MPLVKQNDDCEKKFAILRLTSEGVDRLIIQPVLIKNPNRPYALKDAYRKVLKQYENGTTSWIGWVDQYTLFDPIKTGE